MMKYLHITGSANMRPAQSSQQTTYSHARSALAKSRAGNALFYVLIGVVLLAGLSYTVMQQNDSSGAANRISEERAEIYAAHIISHANAVKSAVAQMLASGSTIDDIDFVKPGEAGFDTPPHIHKVFHPGGGGVTPIQMRDELVMNNNIYTEWDTNTANNVEWTPTTESDITYTFTDVDLPICRIINRILVNDETIPQLSGPLNNYFDEFDSPNQDFLAASCAACVGINSLCVLNNVGDTYGFYNIVAAR